MNKKELCIHFSSGIEKIRKNQTRSLTSPIIHLISYRSAQTDSILHAFVLLILPYMIQGKKYIHLALFIVKSKWGIFIAWQSN